ncbi:ATP-grasp domain-containing protein [Gracilibacillus alcaliphilus]|uniref:ATP-grasp domain-containing protein n=1 Tax=Gracilibacillus alcaliphilus TaxID=1401441 RepID=UPI00195CFBE8|nr:hypothetical protein [Gracilibacillus alcaliphilus]
MKGWLIYRCEDANNNRRFIEWLQLEARELGIELELIFYHDINYGVHEGNLFVRAGQASLPEFVVMRAMDPLLSKQLEYLQIPVFNNAYVAEIANNKAKTHQLFASYGIKMADTMFVSQDQFNPNHYPYPFILKDTRGRSGRQVFKIDDPAQLQPLTADQYIVQSPVTLGKDLRVFVMGNQIIGAVLRQSAQDFKANYTLGGHISLYTLSQKEREQVEQIIKVFPADFIGIDFVFDSHQHLLLNEVEDIVGSRSLVQLTDVNIASMYLKHIVGRLGKEGK